jgi:hypothetical protein
MESFVDWSAIEVVPLRLSDIAFIFHNLAGARTDLRFVANVDWFLETLVNFLLPVFVVFCLGDVEAIRKHEVPTVVLRLKVVWKAM